MGIIDLRRQLAGISGIGALTMRYEDGGATQVLMIGDVVARVPAAAGVDDIRKALVEALDARSAN